MTNKMTYVEALNNALAVVDGETKEKLTALRDSLIKRSENKSDKPTKTQKSNTELKEQILDMINNDSTFHTVTEWMEMFDNAEVTSNQKMSALLKQLYDDGLVTKTTDKRKTLYGTKNTNC